MKVDTLDTTTYITGWITFILATIALICIASAIESLVGFPMEGILLPFAFAIAGIILFTITSIRP